MTRTKENKQTERKKKKESGQTYKRLPKDTYSCPVPFESSFRLAFGRGLLLVFFFFLPSFTRKPNANTKKKTKRKQQQRAREEEQTDLTKTTTHKCTKQGKKEKRFECKATYVSCIDVLGTWSRRRKAQVLRQRGLALIAARNSVPAVPAGRRGGQALRQRFTRRHLLRL